MLIPRRIVTEQHRARVIAYLDTFGGLALIAPGLANVPLLERRLSTRLREGITYRLLTELDQEHHIWIASEDRGRLYSLLHALVEPHDEAMVDLLCASDWGYDPATASFQGFGEIQGLIFELEKRGISQLRLPQTLDFSLRELVDSEWKEREQGIYRL